MRVDLGLVRGPLGLRRTRKHSFWVYAVRIVAMIWRHPANRSHRLRSLLRSIAWQIRKRLARRPMKAKTAGGLEALCLPNSSAASSIIYCSGWPEFDEMRFVHAFLRPGDGFIDGGANIGLYTLLAASRIGPDGWIDAFEPSSDAVGRLRQNVSHNGLSQVRIHSVALGDKAGTDQLVVGWDVSNRLAAEVDYQRARKTVPVSTVRLDDILEPSRRYAMAKLDLEGAELRCLRGAETRLCAANPPIWQIEVTDHLLKKQGTSAAELLGFLERKGYELAVFDGFTGQIRPLEPSSRPPHNVLAIARSSKEEVLRRLSESPQPPF